MADKIFTDVFLNAKPDLYLVEKEKIFVVYKSRPIVFDLKLNCALI